MRERYTDRMGIIRWREVDPGNPVLVAPARRVAPVRERGKPRAPMNGTKRNQVPSGPVLAILDAWWATHAPWNDLADLTGVTTNLIHGWRAKRPKTIRRDLADMVTGAAIETYEPPKRPVWWKRAVIAQGLRDGLSLDAAAEVAGTTRVSALDAARKTLRIIPDQPDSLLIMAAKERYPQKPGPKPK